VQLYHRVLLLRSTPHRFPEGRGSPSQRPCSKTELRPTAVDSPLPVLLLLPLRPMRAAALALDWHLAAPWLQPHMPPRAQELDSAAASR
jgi:hypothetical protein